MEAVSPRVAQRAVEWLVELQAGHTSEETRQALCRWLREHPEHQRAWQHIEAVNGRLHRAASPLGSAVAHAALAAPQSRGRRDAVKTLAVLLFTGGGGWWLQDKTSWREWAADERSAVGERRQLRLPDGSSLALNSGSAVDLHFSATERRVRLRAGEILIQTARDARPFVVETAQGELQPLGTRFSVRQHESESQVAVFEGAVAIRPNGSPGLTHTLRAGEQARFTRTHIGEKSRADDSATAWTDGMLVASGMRLADFIAELGRHRRGHLGCDEAVAGLRVSGTYPLADTDRVLETLRSTLPVELKHITRLWVTVQARP